jgi:putative dehydrogenase
MHPRRIGVIGIGNMGLGIALRLREQGQAVAVRDIDAAREALAAAAVRVPAATPAALAAGCDLVIVVVVDAAQTARCCSDPGRRRRAAPRRHRDAVPDHRPGRCRGLGRAPGQARPRHCSTRRCPAARCAPRRPHEPDGGRCRRPRSSAGSRVLQHMASPVFRIGTGPATARAPSWSTTCWRPSTWGAAEALALATRLGLDRAATLA